MAQEKKQSFMLGAVILTASTLLVKVLGLLFSIPLANFIDADGMAHFYIAYDIFGLFLMLSTAGLPIAVSRMVGTAYSQGRRKEADQVFAVAFWLFFAIGLLGCLAMFFGSEQIAKWMGSPGSSYAIMALSPTMFFISVMSALRGYFQGRSNMVPTAVSQVIEAVSKVIIGVGLAFYIIQQYDSDAWAAVGAIVGVSISAGLGTLYLVVYKLRQKRQDLDVPDLGSSGASRSEMLKSLVLFAIPITVGSCFLSLLDNIDTAVLMDRLQAGLGYSQQMADTMRGILGHARKFFDLPGAFVVPISTSLLPVLSGAIASKDYTTTNRISTISMRVTLLISIPATVGMCLFADPICQLLLFNRQDVAAQTAPLLAVLSVAIVFNSTLFTTNAILQSFGRPMVPVVTMSVGGVVKIVLSYVLIGIPEINVMGSVISTVVSYGLIMVLNLIFVRRCVPNMESFFLMTAPLLLSAGVMGVGSYFVYQGFCLLVSPKIALFPAIASAVLLYVVAAVFFRAVSYDDVATLPKGEWLAAKLHLKKKVVPRHMRNAPVGRGAPNRRIRSSAEGRTSSAESEK